jgi:hypothetical protein
LTELSAFEVRDLGSDQVELRPAEGAGTISEHFHAYRLLDRSTRIRPDTWEPLTRFPRHEYQYRDRAAARTEVERRAGMGSVEGELSALSLALLVLPGADIIDFLTSQLEGLFSGFPDASLWFIATSNVLPARLSFAQIAFQLEVTPDLRLGDRDLPYRRSLRSQSMTGGVHFAEAIGARFSHLQPDIHRHRSLVGAARAGDRFWRSNGATRPGTALTSIAL